MISGLSHVAIAVPDLEAAITLMQDTFGFTLEGRHVNEAQGVRMAYIGIGNGGRIELLEPLREDSPVGRFIQRNPNGGFHHVSMGVPDLDAALAALTSAGVRTVSAPGARNVHDEPIAFLHPASMMGVMIELEESAGPPHAA
ncbi:methylmalonyl-CoA epimerase [soil metagenome]